MTPAEFAELRYLARLDALLRARRRSGCDGKQRFADPVQAARAIRSRHRAAGKRGPYFCPWCCGYHVGGALQPRSERRRSRAAVEGSE